MSSIIPGPIGPATTAKRGTMSAADKTKLDAVTGTNTGDVTVASPAGWLSQVGQALTFALVAAGAAVDGVVNQVAQTWTGVKTFTGALIASAGIQVGALWNTNGAGASDVGVKIGSSIADASVNSAAVLASVRTGIGGTEVNYFDVGKGTVRFGGGGSRAWVVRTDDDGGPNHWEWRFRSGADMTWGNNASVYFGCDISDGYMYSSFGFKGVAAGVTYFKVSAGTGRIDQSGTDSTGTPGAATINKPIGKSAIVAGASSVVITNSLATAAMHCVFAAHARDATCKELIAVCGAGTITFSGTANATAAIPLSWELKGLL